MRVTRIPKSLLLAINTPAQVLGAIMAANEVIVSEAESILMRKLELLEADFLALAGLHKEDGKDVRVLIGDLKRLLWIRAGVNVYARGESSM
jgi:hypothetical protein